ncbi:phosphatase PAP2 family protein [soil metagenome]
MVSEANNVAVDRPSSTRQRHRPAAAIAVVGTVIFALLLLDVLYHGAISSLDDTVAGAMNRHNIDDGGSRRVALVVTQFGSTPVLAAVVVVATVVLAVRGWRRQALFLVVTATVGTSVNNIIKVLVGRSRPHFEQEITAAYGNSFPSGHSMNSTAVYGALLLVIWPLLPDRRHLAALIVTASVVASIAVSRVVLTVHYVSDVLAGMTLGVVIVCVATWVFDIPSRSAAPSRR